MQHKPKEQGTTALFRNPVLEKLARTHISIPLTIYFFGCAILLYINFSNGYTSVAEGIGVFFAGLVFWTWFEYFMHKRIFHMLPTNKIKKRIQYMFHGVHHEFPRDKTRLAMPPAASVLILTGLFFVFQLIMGNYAFTFLPGFVIGYSLYLFVHYSIHAFKPPKNSLNVLWINHSIHHYKDDTVAFGVSSPVWDVIIGTMPKKTYKRKKKKPTREENQEQAHVKAVA
ncbi:MAG: sterol desaturase family protein [Cryomorphaceae bacterium]